MPTHVYVVSGSKLDTPQLVGWLHSSAGRGWASKATVQTDLTQGSPVVGGTVMINVAAIVNNSSSRTMGGKLHSRVNRRRQSGSCRVPASWALDLVCAHCYDAAVRAGCPLHSAMLLCTSIYHCFSLSPWLLPGFCLARVTAECCRLL